MRIVTIIFMSFTFLMSNLSITYGSWFNNESDADKNIRLQTERLNQEANAQIGMPNLTNFQQKKLMKMIIEECDKENLVCYAYLQSEMTGKLIYIGKCLGYGVPFSAQFSSPDKIVDRTEGDVVVAQSEPNGLYMPSSSSATWMIMLDEKNQPRVVYFEPEVVVSPFKFQLGVE